MGSYSHKKQYFLDLLLNYDKPFDIVFIIYLCTVFSGYSGHVYSGHSDIVATFPGTKYIYSIIFRSDIVASWI